MKLPNKILAKRFQTNEYDELIGETVNSIIDYLAEKEELANGKTEPLPPQPDFKFYTKVENGQVICDDTPPQPERSCVNCKNDGGQEVCQECFNFSNWQPRPEPKTIKCSKCGTNYSVVFDEHGLLKCSKCGEVKSYMAIDKPLTIPKKTEPKEDYKALIDEAREYKDMETRNGKWQETLRGKNIRKGYELALTAMEKKIKELEEHLRQAVKGNVPLYKDIVELKDKEINRLKEGIKKYMKSIALHPAHGEEYYGWKPEKCPWCETFKDLEELIKE